MWTLFVAVYDFFNFIGRTSGSPKMTPTRCRARSLRLRRRPRSSIVLRPRQDMLCRIKADSIRTNLEASELMARGQDGATNLQLPIRLLTLTRRGWWRGQPLGQRGMRSTLLQRRAFSLQESLLSATNVENWDTCSASVLRNEICTLDSI